ncbi:MAG: permease-like cell division protein FtsX [Myxococcota bacterium]
MSRALEQAWRHLVAQPVLALCAVLAVAHALFFVGVASWVGLQAGAASDALADGLYVTASLDPALDAAQVKAIADKLAAPDEVAVVTIRTPAEERERLSKVLGPDLMVGLDDLAIPSPVTIDLKLDPGGLDSGSLERLDKLVKELSGVQGVIALPWNPGHIKTLFALSSMVRWVGLGLGLAALIVATALIAQMVRRRYELDRDHMALARAFGATARWVELPHYTAAGLLGALGAVAALLGAGLVQDKLLAVAHLVPGLGQSAPMLGAPFFAWCLAGGIGMALIGAFLSIRRAPVAP